MPQRLAFHNAFWGTRRGRGFLVGGTAKALSPIELGKYVSK